MVYSSNILRGPNFTSPTFLKELDEKSFDGYILEAINHSFTDVYMIDAATNEKLMLKEFVAKSYNLAAALQELQCKKGTIVGIMSENRLEFPIVILGAMLTGATITCFNPAYTIDELQPVYNIAKPTMMFCSSENYPKVSRVVPSSCKIIVFDPCKTSDALPYSEFTQLIRSTKIYKAVKNSPDDLLFILYSSGTTGLPKGVMLTHKNMVFIQKVSHEEKLGEHSGTTEVTVLPMFHAYGLNLMFFVILRNRTLVIMRKFDERLYLSAIQKYQIKHLALVPTLITFLLKNPIVNDYDLSSLESVSCGAAPVKSETEQALKKKFNLKYIQQGYGLTESTLATTVKSITKSKAGTCGSALPGSELKVVDTRTGKILGKNEVGEICIKGPHIMKGYFGNEKATAETLDKDGWLRSGDIGYYDDDGDFFIVDRAKELIKYKGFQVAPAELEALLLTHPSIADSAVIGIPDEAAGELPRAYVVKRDGVNVTENEIIQYIAEKVSPQKKLRGGVEFVSGIPKNPSGKILRRKLRESWAVKNQCKSKM